MLFYTGLIVVLLYFHARSALAIPLQILTDQPFTKKYCHKLEVDEEEYCAVALYFGSRRRGPCDSRYFFISLGSVALVELLDPDGSNTLLLSSVLAIAKLLQGFIILIQRLLRLFFYDENHS